MCEGLSVRRDIVDKRMLGAVRQKLLSPASLAAYADEVDALLSLETRPTDHGRRVAELDREIGRIVDAIAAMGHSDALGGRLRLLEEERREVRQAVEASAQMAEVPSAAELIAAYKAQVLDLESALKGDDVTEARQILQELFGPLTVRQNGTELWVENSAAPASGKIEANGVQIKMVAGTRKANDLHWISLRP